MELVSWSGTQAESYHVLTVPQGLMLLPQKGIAKDPSLQICWEVNALGNCFIPLQIHSNAPLAAVTTPPSISCPRGFSFKKGWTRKHGVAKGSPPSMVLQRACFLAIYLKKNGCLIPG